MSIFAILDALPIDLHLVSFHRKSMGFVSRFYKHLILLSLSKYYIHFKKN